MINGNLFIHEENYALLCLSRSLTIAVIKQQQQENKTTQGLLAVMSLNAVLI